MFQIERIQKVLEYIINNGGRANVNELAEKFHVSSVTIRKDINVLVTEGFAIKTHGGVISVQNKLSYEIPYENKHARNTEQKRIIGIEAAKLIKDNDIIILDAGTTTLQIVKFIRSKNVTVITNDLNIATEVANNPYLELMVVGGMLQKGVYTLLGGNCEEVYKKIHVNKTFIGVDAIDIKFGISNRSFSEISIKQAMKEAADEIIIVSDSSKFHKKLFYSLYPLSDIDVLITEKVDDKMAAYLKEQQIECIVAK